MYRVISKRVPGDTEKVPGDIENVLVKEICQGIVN
jgi:hypothetical protein